MSAFVVHDLKNIVTQLSLMLRNAERHRDNPEFQQDMLMTVEHSVERMRQLMMQLREGTKPPGTACGVQLTDVIERVRQSKMKQGRIVETRIGEPLTTRGHEERLERGHGMTEEFIREHLFKPFQSTKQAGMGIGAYESAQYIREMGGELQAESQETIGTRVTMILPLLDAGTRSDLHETEQA
jgi:signal transduction histidine kinase